MKEQAKQEAERLIGLFYTSMPIKNILTGEKYYSNAKQAALICVDEIVTELRRIDYKLACNDGSGCKEIDIKIKEYWQEVKNHLETI